MKTIIRVLEQAEEALESYLNENAKPGDKFGSFKRYHLVPQKSDQNTSFINFGISHFFDGTIDT